MTEVEYIGSLVSIDCGSSLGNYQGRISAVDGDGGTITLEQPMRNGVPYQVPKVTLKSEDIVDLRIVQKADDYNRTVSDVLTACRGGVNQQQSNGTTAAGADVIRMPPDGRVGNGQHQKNQIQNNNHIISGIMGNGDHKSKQSGATASMTYAAKTKVATKLQQNVQISPSDLLRTSGGASNNEDRSKKTNKSASPNFARPQSRPAHDDNHRQNHQPFQHATDGGGNRRPQQQQQFDGGNNQFPRPQLSDLSMPIDHALMSTDFDFEANLAKFEKLPGNSTKVGAGGMSSSAKQSAALDQLFSSLDGGSGNGGGAAATIKLLTRGGNNNSPSKNIRHDENILQDPSRVYVNAKRSWRYLTDDNVDVHSLTASQKRDLYDRAIRKGMMSEDGFSFAMANSASELCQAILREKKLTTESVLFYMIFAWNDPVTKQIVKYLSRYYVNRGRSIVWILTGGTGSVQIDNEPGVRIITDVAELLKNSAVSPTMRTFVFVIGRQGSSMVDGVSSWLLKNNSSAAACMFVESDWRDVKAMITDEDLLVRLGTDGGGSLIRLPMRISLFWQLPCDEADSDLKSPVFICDTGLPSSFLETELPSLVMVNKDVASRQQKGKQYKFPFTNGNVVKLRKL